MAINHVGMIRDWACVAIATLLRNISIVRNKLNVYADRAIRNDRPRDIPQNMILSMS